MASKSLNPQQAKRAQELLQAILRDRFEGNQSDMADAMGIKQPTLWAALNGKKGVGGKVLMGLHAVDPKAYDTIIGQGAVVAPANESTTSTQEHPPAPSFTVLKKHARSLLALPPFDYSEEQAAELVEKVLAFRHDTLLEAEEIARLADHIARLMSGQPPRDPSEFSAPYRRGVVGGAGEDADETPTSRSPGSTLPPRAKAAAKRELEKTGKKGGGFGGG